MFCLFRTRHMTAAATHHTTTPTATGRAECAQEKGTEVSGKDVKERVKVLDNAEVGVSIITAARSPQPAARSPQPAAKG
jgi:hypothetical protein